MKTLPLALFLATLPVVWAQSQPPQNSGQSAAVIHFFVSFELDRPGFNFPHWGIAMQADGKGFYWEPAAVTGQNPNGRTVRSIEVGPATLARIKAGRQPVLGHYPCETRAKNIAQTGRKTLIYSSDVELAGSATVSCTFNYSDDKGVMDATAAFQAVAETIQQSARLEHDRRFDRLGLDADMNALAQEIKDGNAIELGNIASTLRTIARDSEVLERVRALAARWLAQLPDSTSASR